jgi:hypothetical protein
MAHALITTGWVFLLGQVLFLIFGKTKESMVVGAIGFVLNMAGAVGMAL